MCVMLPSCPQVVSKLQRDTTERLSGLIDADAERSIEKQFSRSLQVLNQVRRRRQQARWRRLSGRGVAVVLSVGAVSWLPFSKRPVPVVVSALACCAMMTMKCGRCVCCCRCRRRRAPSSSSSSQFRTNLLDEHPRFEDNERLIKAFLDNAKARGERWESVNQRALSLRLIEIPAERPSVSPPVLCVCGSVPYTCTRVRMYTQRLPRVLRPAYVNARLVTHNRCRCSLAIFAQALYAGMNALPVQMPKLPLKVKTIETR
jgi:hypothetical protein